MVAKPEKTGGEEISNHQSHRTKSFRSKPSWLLCTISGKEKEDEQHAMYLDDRMKTLTRRQQKENNSTDSFSARANTYYHEQPQLIELLNDLYNAYLSLADRYCQALTKNQKQNVACSSSIPHLRFDGSTDTDKGYNRVVIDSDAESSLSYQAPLFKAQTTDGDSIIANLVMKTVEYEIVQDELNTAEIGLAESCQKFELQRKLLDVLDSERLILLNNNAMLRYRVTALAEENKGLVSETLFLKRKATELARCVLNTREAQRVCMLNQKIEDLQGQIFRLEKRNKKYYDQLVKQNKKGYALKKVKNAEEVNLEGCYQVHDGGVGIGLGKCFSFNVKKFGDQNAKIKRAGGLKLWDKVKKFELFNCISTS